MGQNERHFGRIILEPKDNQQKYLILDEEIFGEITFSQFIALKKLPKLVQMCLIKHFH